MNDMMGFVMLFSVAHFHRVANLPSDADIKRFFDYAERVDVEMERRYEARQKRRHAEAAARREGP